MANRFVTYSKTKSEFIAAGLPTTYNDSIVFIKGDANGNGSCIYTHNMYFGNFAELIASLNYLKGVSVNGGTPYNGAGGGSVLNFTATDPTTVALIANQTGISIGLNSEWKTPVDNAVTNLGSKNDAANKDGSAFARIANLYALVADLTGGSTDSIEGQINTAVTTLKTELLGEATATGDYKTIKALSDAVSAIEDSTDTKSDGSLVNVSVTTTGGVVTNVGVTTTNLSNALNAKADLTNGKIPLGQIPDVVLGQVMFGGTITQNNSASPSADFKTKYNVSTNTTTIQSTDYSKYEGVYFIVSGVNNGTVLGVSGVNTGDWIISTGVAWVKIDNTDAVSSVAGLTGTITAAGLATELSKSSVTGALATKSEVSDAVDFTTANDTNVTLTYDKTNKKFTVASTAALTSAITKANSAYQKASTGIPLTDLADSVQKSLGKADAAAPQATTYTKDEVDAMWTWLEL